MVDVDAVSAHRDLVRELMRPGGPLHASSPNATTRNLAWFDARGGIRPERDRLHTRLIAEHRAAQPHVRAERRAIVLAGPPGAGKSSVLRSVLGERRGQWLVVDADEFKHALLRHAISDGSYAGAIVPEEVRRLEAAGERFAPLELASLVHEESSRVAKRARNDAIAGGLNVVVDTVLSGERSALELGQRLQRAGYEVRVIDVETTYAISAARVEQRWREVTRAFQDNEQQTGLGGRWVPSEYTRALFPVELAGRSTCEQVARTLAERCGAVMRHEVHRVADPAAPPLLESAHERARVGGPLLEAAAASAAREAAVGRVDLRSPATQREPYRGREGGLAR